MEFRSLKDLVRIVENSLAVQFYGLPGGQTNVLRKTVLKVLAAVLGGALYMLSLVEKRIWKNRFCSTCDVAMLDGFGVEYGVPHKPPMAATGFAHVVLADGVNSVTFPKGTALTDSSSSLEYEVTSATVVSGGSGNVPIKALALGKESNLENGVPLQFREADIAGIEEMYSYRVDGGVLFNVEVDGDVQDWGETAEDYRARLLNRIQNPVNGGSKNDYYRWATKFPFVTDAFVIPNQPNVNSVSVVVANYNSDNVSCTSDQVAEVSRYMTDDVRRHITADVRVFSVTPVNITISATVLPFNEAVKTSVDTAVKKYLRAVPPGSVVTFEDLELVVRSNSTAESFHIMSARKGTTAVSNLTFELTFSTNSVRAEVAKCTINMRNGSI